MYNLRIPLFDAVVRWQSPHPAARNLLTRKLETLRYITGPTVKPGVSISPGLESVHHIFIFIFEILFFLFPYFCG